MVDNGTYEELQTKGIDFAALLREYEDEEENPKEEALSRQHSVRSRESDVNSPEDVAFDDVRESLYETEICLWPFSVFLFSFRPYHKYLLMK